MTPLLILTPLLIPAAAGAYATLEGPPQFSSAPGLPDGRVYEQVSPADKNGNEAGGSTTPQDVGARDHYGLASADGNAVLFEGTGPIGESPSGSDKWFVATKKTGEPGWSTRSLLPASAGHETKLDNGLFWLDPSADLSHAMVEPETPFVQGGGCTKLALYLTGPDPFLAAPCLAPDPDLQAGESGEPDAPVGGTPDFSTVYFTSASTLLAQDASRAPEAWGFYENKEGVLREAGVLPDGEVSEWGAVPAASGHRRSRSGNQVSADGSRAFFVSPDPAAVGSCKVAEEGKGESAVQVAAACAPQLYVRENGDRTVLVSQSQLPGKIGEPAPGGVLGKYFNLPTLAFLDHTSYVFASPDGSQAFFQSASALTQPAEEASPGAEPKTYDFDLNTGVLTYLPGVTGEIVASDGDGSSFAFVRSAAGASAAELDLWAAGPGGGSVTSVTGLPEYPSVPEARMSSDGSVLVFQTEATIAGFNNRGTHTLEVGETEPGSEEIYRYDVPANTLGCVSCAPAGITPRGAASMSILNTVELYFNGTLEENPAGGIVDERGISADGDRIFFDSPDPLVPQDSNTSSPPVSVGNGGFVPQGDDVYEWENGVVYLISTGKSPLDSYLLDSSENGNDVFFATAEGLVPGDTDGGYDIYDARIPHAGEPYPPAAVSCEGSVCQGPPNVPAPLTPPASATFSGLGNPTPETTPTPAASVTKKTVKCAKGKKLSHGKCVKVKSKNKKAKAKKASHNGRVKS